MALKLKLNLVDVLKSGFTTQQRKALTPAIHKPVVKSLFGLDVIDFIKARTEKGRDKRGNSFRKYSKQYIKSRDFQIFGKSRFKVNLRLSGEMRASIHTLGQGKTTVTIGINDPEQEVKAKGHIGGKGNLPVRDFWGITLKEQTVILKRVFKTVGESGTSNEELAIFGSILRGLENGEE